MRRSRLLLLAVLVTCAAQAGGRSPASGPLPASPRGWLTATGASLLGLGAGAAVLGVHFLLVVSDSNRTLGGYYPTPQSAPTPAEAPAVKLLQRRRDGAQALLLPVYALAGAALVGGVVCLALDRPAAGVSPALAVLPGGGLLGVAGRF